MTSSNVNKNNPYLGYFVSDKVRKISEPPTMLLPINNGFVGTFHHSPCTQSFLTSLFMPPMKVDKSTQTEEEEDEWELV